jgi:hypothetical protein
MHLRGHRHKRIEHRLIHHREVLRLVELIEHLLLLPVQRVDLLHQLLVVPQHRQHRHFRNQVDGADRGLFVAAALRGLGLEVLERAGPAAVVVGRWQFGLVQNDFNFVIVIKERPTKVDDLGVVLGVADLPFMGLAPDVLSQLTQYLQVVLVATAADTAHLVLATGFGEKLNRTAVIRSPCGVRCTRGYAGCGPTASPCRSLWWLSESIHGLPCQSPE